MTWTKQLLV